MAAKKRGTRRRLSRPLRGWVSSARTYLKGLENPVALRYLSEQRMCAIKLLLYLVLGGPAVRTAVSGKVGEPREGEEAERKGRKNDGVYKVARNL